MTSLEWIRDKKYFKVPQDEFFRTIRRQHTEKYFHFVESTTFDKRKITTSFRCSGKTQNEHFRLRLVKMTKLVKLPKDEKSRIKF